MLTIADGITAYVAGVETRRDTFDLVVLAYVHPQPPERAVLLQAAPRVAGLVASSSWSNGPCSTPKTARQPEGALTPAAKAEPGSSTWTRPCELGGITTVQRVLTPQIG